jgi:3-oxoacyl-[acyl-carrier protein] reductase
LTVLKGKVFVITGASSGIGAATARALIAAGALVALGARRHERLRVLVDELGADNALAVQMDVRQPADCERLVAAAVERFGTLDGVVVNAGQGLYGDILDGSDEQLAAMMDINYSGTVWTVRAAARRLQEQGSGGDIVIISSVAGLRGDANEAVYAGTMFAQLGLAGALDRELRAKGIRVTSILPASVDTEFALGQGRAEGDPAASGWLRPDDVAHCVRTVLEQPPTVRTTVWAIWPMTEDS